MKTVQIMLHDDNRVMVGEKSMNAGMPPETIPGISGGEGEEAGMEGMQQVRNVDEALEVARNLLTGPSLEEAQEGEAAFQEGFGPLGPDQEEGTPY